MATRFCTSESRGRLTPVGSNRLAGVLLESSCMPRAIPPTVCQAVCLGHQRGLAPALLAERFHLPLRTVYHVLRRGLDPDGQAPPPAYHRPPAGPHAPAALLQQA